MNRLWRYEDYVERLSHKNILVRKWAFRAITSRYKRRYTDRVAELIHDDDEFMVSETVRYLTNHQAVEHAPAILEKFKNSEGIVAGNCAPALAEMDYEPALAVMLEELEITQSLERTMGILDYLGRKRGEKSRAALRKAVAQLEDGFSLGDAITSLFAHCHTEDIPLAMGKWLDLPDIGAFDGSFAKGLLIPLDAIAYFTQLMDYGENPILSKPAKTIDDLFSNNTQIPDNPSFIDEVVALFEKRQYRDVVNLIFQAVKKSVAERYSGKEDQAWLEELLEKDNMCVHLLEHLSRDDAVWERLEKRKSERTGFVSLTVSIYFAVMEREAYIGAMHPEAEVETLLSALGNSGPGIPEDILKRIETLAPIKELKTTLSNELLTWADISIVRLMGRIGHPEFVPDLIRVIKESDSMDFIYSDGITAIQTLDESADEAVLEAIRVGEIDPYASFDILDHLPYAEAYDLALSLWESEEDEFMDSYEILAAGLENIGDSRGIPYLQDLWAESIHADFVGDALECLCVLHDTEIPELTEIREQRKNRQQAEMKESENWRIFDEDQGNEFEDWIMQMPVRREGPKIGRNDPCPCGSGKKYKKCCLNK